METEQNLTLFNSRVQTLQAVTGKSQTEIAELLEVSRTTLHYYCTGQNVPKPAALYRLEQAERQVRTLAPDMPRAAGDQPLPEDDAATIASGGRLRTEIELTRHLRWLRGARQEQQEAALSAQRHLRKLDGWIAETEAELRRVQEQAGGPLTANKSGRVGRSAAASRGERSLLRDIDTVSLPIFGALPAGWPQTREGIRKRRPIKSVQVKRGRFPEGVFGLEVRGDSMNAARRTPIFDGDVVVLLSPEQREPQPEDIVAALIDGETCLKRLKTRKRAGGAFLKSESNNPVHGEIHPAHELVIQGVFVGKL